MTAMMNTALQTIATKALPALSGEQMTYNAAKNVFLSQGYTSAAGNMYYKAIRLSNRLVVAQKLATAREKAPKAVEYLLRLIKKQVFSDE